MSNTVSLVSLVSLEEAIEDFRKLTHTEGLTVDFPKDFVTPDSPADFLHEFITNYNADYNTNKGGYRFTGTSRNRSINEIFDI